MRVSYVTFCDPDGFSATSNGPIRVCHQPDTVNVTEVIFLQRKKNRSPDLYPLAGCLLIHSFFFFCCFFICVLLVTTSLMIALIAAIMEWFGCFNFWIWPSQRSTRPPPTHTHTRPWHIIIIIVGRDVRQGQGAGKR